MADKNYIDANSYGLTGPRNQFILLRRGVLAVSVQQ